MGNKIARTTQASATEYYLHDLPSTYNLVLLDVVSRGRFLKSVLCKHDEGLLLVKVYFKRAGEPLDLKEHERRLERIRRAFQGLEGSHVLPFQRPLLINAPITSKNRGIEIRSLLSEKKVWWPQVNSRGATSSTASRSSPTWSPSRPFSIFLPLLLYWPSSRVCTELLRYGCGRCSSN